MKTRPKSELIKEANEELWNVRDEYQGLRLTELKSVQDQMSLPYAVCALNVLGDLNVGIILRNAVLMGASKAILFGKRSYDKRSTVGAQNYLDIEKVDGLIDQETLDHKKFWSYITENKLAPIFIEQGGTELGRNSLEIILREIFNKSGLFPCFIFGNEGTGIPDELMNHPEYKNPIKISIPQRGVLRSYNVSSASSIVMYEAMNILESFVG